MFYIINQNSLLTKHHVLFFFYSKEAGPSLKKTKDRPKHLRNLQRLDTDKLLLSSRHASVEEASNVKSRICARECYSETNNTFLQFVGGGVSLQHFFFNKNQIFCYMLFGFVLAILCKQCDLKCMVESVNYY